MNYKVKLIMLVLIASIAVAVAPIGASAQTLLKSGLQGTIGSTVGPDGALYIPEGTAGKVTRIDPETGADSTFAEGLPIPPFTPFGGGMDIAFVDGTAYVLVTLTDFGDPSMEKNGIYRIDGLNDHELIADIGSWAAANPPSYVFPYELPWGVQYALQVFKGTLLVSDGHHNRILQVGLHSYDDISEFAGFENIVPTGMEAQGNTVMVAESGPVPHLPEDGKILAINSKTGEMTTVASGAPLMVDVQRGRGTTFYGLSQGEFGGGDPASPALPFKGALVKVNGDGTVTELATEINLPTSLEIIGDTAYIVSLAGEIWTVKIDKDQPWGKSR